MPNNIDKKKCCINDGDCKEKQNSSSFLNRRSFLKFTGGAFLAGKIAGGSSASGNECCPGTPRIHSTHHVPVDKELSRDWVRNLYEKGDPEIYSGNDLETIGMPIGGIAAGQMYLLGDGTLGSWHIFNKHIDTGPGVGCYEGKKPPKPVEQGFAIAAEINGVKYVKKLNREEFPDCKFLGQYPIGKVWYEDSSLPFSVELEAFSPFIPLNEKDSALPVTLFHHTVRNQSDEDITISLLGWMENAVGKDSRKGQRRTEVNKRGRITFFQHSIEEIPTERVSEVRPKIVLEDFEGSDYGDWTVEGEAFGSGPAEGTLENQNPVSGFEGKKLVNTFYNGDVPHGKLTSPEFTITRNFINFLIGGGSHDGLTCINLIVDGDVVRTATGKSSEHLLWHSWEVRQFEGQNARLQIIDEASGGWGHINIDQIEMADERREDFDGPLSEYPDAGTMALATIDKTTSREDAFGIFNSMSQFVDVEMPNRKESVYSVWESRCEPLMTSKVVLFPGESKTFTFALAWHFPNADQGQFYANDFKDASQVAGYVLKHHERLSEKTRLWHDTYYDSTLPYWLLDRLMYPTSNLATATCRWWKNGRFWAWEGVGCCHGTCTHVWNYAHAAARLFPQLERSAREMQDLGPAMLDDGLIGFRGESPQGAYAADGQAGTILKCYREHLMSPDDGFLEKNWPKIKKALEFSIRQDANKDGLIENTQHNTYDINFEGPNTFVGALYLGALRAGEEMAREMGDNSFADMLRAIFEKGSQLSHEQLWNGEYFVQKTNVEQFVHQYGDGCLSDQLFGQGWAHQVGLGYLYPKDSVKTALESVFKYNWTPDVTAQVEAHTPERFFIDHGEPGLFICTWPKSEHLGDRAVRYKNEVWTGIEYQLAGHMVWEGLIDESMILVRSIHDRYHPSKRNPYNEVECGDHYARALASWGVFTALSGYDYNGPKGYLRFAPNYSPEYFKSAFTAAEGWGTFLQFRQGNRQKEHIMLRWGTLPLKTLSFACPTDWKNRIILVSQPGKTLKFEYEVKQGNVTVSLPRQRTLKAGESVIVEILA